MLKNLLITGIVLFLISVFLDQNYVQVPVKFFVGNPFHFNLSLIIIISIFIGVILTALSILSFNSVRNKVLKKRLSLKKH
uniref:Magnetosome protein Man2 n=1 Tax=uncultured Nitrospirota bacterium TaxID=170969 RepID=A0A142BTW4_9BACT|nr:magnetosome protein Man2 [uncultured Nitrospirota bacterium]